MYTYLGDIATSSGDGKLSSINGLINKIKDKSISHLMFIPSLSSALGNEPLSFIIQEDSLSFENVIEINTSETLDNKAKPIYEFIFGYGENSKDVLAIRITISNSPNILTNMSISDFFNINDIEDITITAPTMISNYSVFGE